MAEPYSLLILTSGRDEHLAHTIAGVNAMEVLPAELIVGFMHQSEHPDIRSAVPVRTLDIDDGGRLPLAFTRNALASAAETEQLVFLDVDCIPMPTFGGTLMQDLERYGGLVMGTPWYLPPDTKNVRDAVAHPGRAQLRSGPSDDYDLFWSLCFAIRRADFQSIGGFDETFVGYGGEDTDFAWTARASDVGLSFSEARVAHQFHPSGKPPVTHLDDIVVNAAAFRSKWQRWPMTGWLQAFADMGLIAWSDSATTITKLRSPSADEIDAAQSLALFS